MFCQWIIVIREHSIAFNALRDISRPFEMHNSLTFSWSALPYSLNPITWFTYYHLLDDFVRQSTETRQTLYIHGRVLLPFPVMSNLCVRMNIYRLFMINTPYRVVQCFTRIKFRSLFVSTSVVGDRISIDGLRVSTEVTEPSLYAKQLTPLRPYFIS